MIDPLLDKTPPHNIDTEESVLSSLFMDNSGFDEIFIEPEDFYKSAHQKIFRAMLDLRDKQEPVDLVTIGQYLDNDGKLSEIGGASFLASISDSAPSAVNVKKYAEDIKELSVKREIIITASNILEKTLSGGDCNELLSYAQKTMLEIQNTSTIDELHPIKDGLYKHLGAIEDYQTKDMGNDFKIGLPFMDKVLRLTGGKLIIIAGMTSFGKTSFALSIGKGIAENYNTKVGVLSLEMDKDSLYDKCLSIDADVNNMKFYKKGGLNQSEFGRLAEATDRLSNIPLFIDDKGRNIEDIKRICRKMKRDGFGLIIIDQFSHVSVPGAKTELERYTKISNELAMLKKELRLPIIALSQFNRTADEFNPTVRDLKHSGALENDADIILLLSKPSNGDTIDYVTKPKGKDYRYFTVKINCPKNRNGAVGYDAGDYFVVNRGMFLLRS